VNNTQQVPVACIDMLHIAHQSKQEVDNHLGKPTSQSPLFARYRPSGFEEILVRFQDDRAIAVTAYLTRGCDSSTEAVTQCGAGVLESRDGVSLTGDSWFGVANGFNLIKATRDVNVGGWDCVQVLTPESGY